MEITKEKFSQGEWSACCLDAKPHFVFAGEKTVCTMLCNDKTMPAYEPMEAEVTIDECVANAILIQSAPKMFKALVEISKGEGRYDMDRLRHAANTIEDMQKLALDAIKEATEPPPIEF